MQPWEGKKICADWKVERQRSECPSHGYEMAYPMLTSVYWGRQVTKGTFIAEYVGELLSDEDAHTRGLEYDNRGLR